jgi:hypothetical protein
VQAVESKVEKVSMSRLFVQAARRANGYDEMGRKIVDVTPESEPDGDVEW